MTTRRKRNDTKQVPLEPLENRLFPCYYTGGRVVLASFNRLEIDTLTGHGYGKGTLSRSTPNFRERALGGLIGASKSDPFATPTRFTASSAPTSPTGTETTESESPVDLSNFDAEELQFGREEALYLVIRFKALSITLSLTDAPLQPLELLKLFYQDQNDFLSHYFVYQHYRQLGWVVKLGGKNGVNFLLYGLGGPANAHAHYGVKIQLPHEDVPSLQTLSWQVSTRVLDTVAKSLLLSMVTPGWDASDFEKDDFSIAFDDWFLDELALRRWDVNTSTRV